MLEPLLLPIVEGESALEGRCAERDRDCDDCIDKSETEGRITDVCAVSRGWGWGRTSCYCCRRLLTAGDRTRYVRSLSWVGSASTEHSRREECSSVRLGDSNGESASEDNRAGSGSLYSGMDVCASLYFYLGVVVCASW